MIVSEAVVSVCKNRRVDNLWYTGGQTLFFTDALLKKTLDLSYRHVGVAALLLTVGQVPANLECVWQQMARLHKSVTR
jgi:hypothetical protein